MIWRDCLIMLLRWQVDCGDIDGLFSRIFDVIETRCFAH